MAKARRRFRINFDAFESVDGIVLPATSIDVSVYDTTRDLQEALRKTGIPAKLAREAGGGFTYPTDKPVKRGHLGTIRLALDSDMFEASVIHEATHAAVRATKHRYGVAELRLNDAKNAEREEVLAYYTHVFAYELLAELT